MLSGIEREANPARQAPESTVGQPMAVRRQGIYVEYSMEYSKRHALSGILVSTVDELSVDVELKSKAFFAVDSRASPAAINPNNTPRSCNLLFIILPTIPYGRHMSVSIPPLDPL
eukprot:6285041-Pyramimonas_sp.AAC.1